MTSEGVKQLVTPARWRALCDAAGLEEAEGEYARLRRGWSSMGRRYHTLDHLAACLREFDNARELAQRPAEVELALWFHDAIYRTHRSDNELRCAEWASTFLTGHGASKNTASNVHKLVMATAHAPGALEGDAALVVDIDLAILGQPQPVYDEFERNVRKEYWWVPRKRFTAARRAILQSFLDRPALYRWPDFRERYEAPARTNLQRAIEKLQ